MIQFDGGALAQSVLNSALSGAITAGAAIGAAALAGGTKMLRGWLEAHRAQALSAIVARAAEIVQGAADNEAGQIALQVANGAIKVGDVAAFASAAKDSAARIGLKVPQSLAALKPVPGAIEQAVLGKVAAKLPQGGGGSGAAVNVIVQAAEALVPGAMPKGDLEARCKWVVRHLGVDLGLKDFQAIGAVGNLVGESGLAAVQEVSPLGGGRGGYGWAQWTGPRRRDFEGYCEAKGLPQASDAANYGFLVHELLGTERGALLALRATGSLAEACQVFEAKYERAGVIRMEARQTASATIASQMGLTSGALS